ncbi:hypothetical protein EON65_04425 [archaeon]|nr:MAG: hypothetical protein EON65_04425 [archaeon]
MHTESTKLAILVYRMILGIAVSACSPPCCAAPPAGCSAETPAGLLLGFPAALSCSQKGGGIYAPGFGAEGASC